MSPSPRFKTGSRKREKKSVPLVTNEYLHQALENFSGYIAIDELYDGPFCVLSLVDNRRQTRLIYEVLDHDPTGADIERFLRRFRGELDARGLQVLGITTDGSSLYPEALQTVFPGVPHQVCEFHVVADITKVILRAVARVRKTFAAAMPKLPRGRPSKAQRRVAARRQRLQQKVKDLFDHRYLFVQKHLSAREQETLHRITRGQPQLRTLREIMDEVYRLFDRRCRTDTALAKLAKLRQRVRRFTRLGKTLQKLFRPSLQKALTFLDDDLLPSTSNAVERGNRRHRKMQKTVYRVRTHATLSQRVALDLLRDQRSPNRQCTLFWLHRARAG